MKKIVKKRSIEALKANVSLPAVIADHFELKEADGYLVAPSPFHPAQPMTLCVNAEVNRFRCTASGKHGDAIDFVRLAYKLRFVEAVEFLAKRFGFKLEYEEGPSLDIPQFELPLVV